MAVLVITAGEEVNMAMIPPSADGIWFELQAELVVLSINSTHIIMDTANHMSMFSNKSNADMVADQNRGLVSKTQK